jgi:hypothetical protein
LHRIRFLNNTLDEEQRGVRNFAIGGSRQSKPRTSNYGGESAPTGQLYRQAKRTTVAANHGNCRISSTSSIPNPRPRDRHHYFLMLQPKRDGSGVTLTRGAIAKSGTQQGERKVSYSRDGN